MKGNRAQNFEIKKTRLIFYSSSLSSSANSRSSSSVNPLSAAAGSASAFFFFGASAYSFMACPVYDVGWDIVQWDFAFAY